jgi:type I restriction enzyme M protein
LGGNCIFCRWSLFRIDEGVTQILIYAAVSEIVGCEWCIVSCSDIYFIDSCAECGEESYSNSNAIVMSYVLDPEPGQEVYDPCCGSGGLLIKCFLRFRDKYGDKTSTAPLRFYGQETLHPTYAMAKMNMFIHDMETEIRLGDTMVRPFTNVDGSLRKFDMVTANPMWNQNFSRDVYENDPFDRFQSGYPPPSSADWGWTSTAWNCHTA